MKRVKQTQTSETLKTTNPACLQNINISSCRHVSRVVLCCGFTLSDAEGHGDDSVGAGDAVQTADEVRQVVQNTQVVFHHDDVPETHDDHQSNRGSKHSQTE